MVGSGQQRLELSCYTKDQALIRVERRAAEEAIRLISGHPYLEGWEYAVAHESDVRSSESWEDLPASANPGRTMR